MRPLEKEFLFYKNNEAALLEKYRGRVVATPKG
jgi:hypothetical protein